MGKQREAAGAEKPAPTASSGQQAAPPPVQQPEEAVDHGDSVTVAIAKRARALRKKLHHLDRIEQSRADGKVLNAEQEQTLAGRPAIEAALDELERLAVAVPGLVAEERALAAAEAEAKAARDHEQSRPPPPPPPVDRLVAALYVSYLFGDGSPHSPRAAEHQAEREACLAWDSYEGKVCVLALPVCGLSCALTPFASLCANCPAQPDGLTPADLADIGRLGRALTARGSQLVSHDEALRRCVEEAAAWMQGAGKLGDVSGALCHTPHPPHASPHSAIYRAGCAVERLANRVERVIASAYFRQAPVVAQLDVQAAGI